MFESLNGYQGCSETVLDMISAAYHEKPLIFIETTFREEFFSHHGAVNEVDCYLFMRSIRSKLCMALTKELHFSGRLQANGVKLPKTADHWWLRIKSTIFCL